MSGGFTDLFSDRSAGYAQSRPTYPDSLYAFIAGAALSRARAWDCATGSGQAAIGLARRFAAVEATDASAEQVSHAIPAANVRYSVQPAEGTDFAAESFDAVCVAQAFHWFDHDRFHAEVKRVLRPRGVLAVWCYDWARVTPAVDFALQRHLLAKIKPYWPRQNLQIANGYRDLPFPYEELAVPEARIEMSWNVAQYVAYAETWTATRRYVAEHGPGIVEDTAAALARAWDADPGEPRVVAMPLHIRCGRKA